MCFKMSSVLTNEGGESETSMITLTIEDTGIEVGTHHHGLRCKVATHEGP